ncbi:MAG: hypothetical protein Q7J35_08425 [Candidatus Methanoperedens sp.]|nr:hypothetical protein [Candidatus Methanoperedens sp.]
MRIIIIGAGEVGYHIAKTLCRDNDVFTSRTNDPWYKSSEVEFAKGDDLVFRRIRSNGKEDPRTNVKS